MPDYKGIARLVTRAQEGDQAAFSKLYEQFQLQFYYLALKLVKNPSDAADMVQDAMLDLYLNLEKIEDPMAFTAFAKQVITRKCLHFLNSRKEQVHRDSVEEEPDGLVEDIDFLPEESLENQEMREEILNIIDNLPDKLRVVIILFYYQQLSMAEIGTALDLSVKNVSVRLSRARAAMKKQLESKHGSTQYLYAGGGILLSQLFERQLASGSAAFLPPSLPPLPAAAVAPAASAAPVATTTIAGKVTAVVAAAAIVVTGVVASRTPPKEEPAPPPVIEEVYVAPAEPPISPVPAVSEPEEIIEQELPPEAVISMPEEAPPIIEVPEVNDAPTENPEPDEPVAPENTMPRAPWVPILMIEQHALQFALGELHTAEDLISQAVISALDRSGNPLPIELPGYSKIDWNRADTYHVTVHVPATDDSEERWDFLTVKVVAAEDSPAAQ